MSALSYSQSSPDIPGDAEAGDKFGSALAVVSGNKDRAMLVGVPGDVTNDTGMVNVIPLGAGAPRSWVRGVGGIPSAGSSRFGASVGSVD